MFTMEQYVTEVMDHVYAPPSQLERFEIWLRHRIHRCREHGRDLEQIINDLGQPEEVAREMMFARHAIRYGGVLRRVPAFLIDMAICLLMTAPPFALAAVMAAESDFPPFVFLAIGTGLASLVTWLVYFTLKEARHGQTLGKRIMGLRVIRRDGSPVSHKDSLLRALVFFTPFAPFDLMFTLFNRKRRRVADILSGTLVVRE